MAKASNDIARMASLNLTSTAETNAPESLSKDISEGAAWMFAISQKVQVIENEKKILLNENTFLNNQIVEKDKTIASLRNLLNNNTANKDEIRVGDLDQLPDAPACTRLKPMIEAVCRELELSGIKLRHLSYGMSQKVARLLSARTGATVKYCATYLSARDYDNRTTAKDLKELRAAYVDLGLNCPI